MKHKKINATRRPRANGTRVPKGAKVPKHLRALAGVDPRLLPAGAPYPCDDPRVGTLVPGGRSTPGGRVVACASRGPAQRGHDLYVGGAPLSPRQIAGARRYAEGEARRAERRAERASTAPVAPRRRGRPVAEVYGPRASFGTGAVEPRRPLGYGAGEPEPLRPPASTPASAPVAETMEVFVGKTTTQNRRKRFDVFAHVGSKYIPGLRLVVAEEHGGGSWAVRGSVYHGDKRSETTYGEGLSRAAASALAERVLRAASIERTAGGAMAVLPAPQAPVFEAQNIDRLTNAQATSSWRGNHAAGGDPWIANRHLAIRRAATGYDAHGGGKKFRPWHPSLFKALDTGTHDVDTPMPTQHIERLAFRPEDRESARLVGWADTGGASTRRVATFVGNDGTLVSVNADYVALIERNLGGHARPFVSRGDPLAGVQWFDHRGAVSAMVAGLRPGAAIIQERARANPSSRRGSAHPRRRQRGKQR